MSKGMKVSKNLDPLEADVACDVLESLRQCWKTRNFAPALGYIEELQSMFDRMESALQVYGDSYGSYTHVKDDVRELKDQRRNLRMDISKMKEQLKTLTEQKNDIMADMTKIGSEVVVTLQKECGCDLAAAGAIFTALRKRGIIFLKEKSDD